MDMPRPDACADSLTPRSILPAQPRTARLDADNHSSARLAARLGMRQEAHLVQNEWFKGRWSDELGFAILEDEWRAMRHDRCTSA